MFVCRIRILFVLFISLFVVVNLLSFSALISEYLRFVDVGCRRHLAHTYIWIFFYMTVFVLMYLFMFPCIYYAIALTLLSCQLAWYENFIIQIFIHDMSTYVHIVYVVIIYVCSYIFNIYILIYSLRWRILWFFLLFTNLHIYKKVISICIIHFRSR